MKFKSFLVPVSAMLLSLTMFIGNERAWAKPSMTVTLDHSLVVKADGTLWQWGIWGGEGGRATTSDFPLQVGQDSNWDSVSTSAMHTLAVKNDGTLWGWGGNNFFGLGTQSPLFIDTPTRIGMDSDWAEVIAQWSFSVALKKDGTLWGWGNSFPGKPWDWDYAPNQFGLDSDWVAISAGTDAILALKADGTLWAWGENLRGALGVGDLKARSVPTQVGSGGWAAVATNTNFTLAVKRDGTLWGWGWNSAGQLGTSKQYTQRTPKRLTTKKGWISVAVGDEHSLGLQTDGSLWAWGRNDYAQCGTGSKQQYQIGFTRVGSATDWQAVTAGDLSSAGIKTNGEMYTWGYGYLGSNTLNSYSPAAIADPGNWKMMDAGGGFSVGVRTDGSLWSWGGNFKGQLGLGDTVDRIIPTRVGTGVSWVTADSGKAHTLAVMEDGTLWSWGENTKGELGRGVAQEYGAYYTTPGKLADSGPWVMVSAGDRHTLGLKYDGTLWAWGRNSEGQLGIGLDAIQGTAHPLPVQVGSANNWTHISAGYRYSIAVNSDRELWAWGQSGTTGVVVAVPTRVGADNDWASANAGYQFSTALKTTGTLWWKAGGTPSEVLLPEGTTCLAASPGVNYAVAILSDGSLWGWGSVLGWPGGSSTSPLQIGTDKGWKMAAATPWDGSGSGPHTLVLKADSTLHSWGDNRYGQLGNGSSGYLLVPTLLGF